MRRHLPESPRWLLLHGRVAEAEAVVGEIEADVARTAHVAQSFGPVPGQTLQAKGRVTFAAGNLLGPFVLGHWFDSVGRRPMIAATYTLAGALIAIAGYGLYAGWLTAATRTARWCAAFFVASSAASSAYLTVSELFPVELRGMAIEELAEMPR